MWEQHAEARAQGVGPRDLISTRSSVCGILHGMIDKPLTPADPADVRDTLSYALRYNRSGKRTQDRASVTADAAAEHLIDALRRAGFVIMRGPPALDHIGALPPQNPLHNSGWPIQCASQWPA